MTDSDPIGSTRPEEASLSPQPEPDTFQPAEDPGYLVETGQVVGDDGSVVPIIGGLPAAEGSAWDIGAPLADRGAGLAEELGSPLDQASRPVDLVAWTFTPAKSTASAASRVEAAAGCSWLARTFDP